jgi:hypothetical protein
MIITIKVTDIQVGRYNVQFPILIDLTIYILVVKFVYIRLSHGRCAASSMYRLL